MKKVIGIYCGNLSYIQDYFWDSDVCKEKGLGGSETWAVEIATAFQKLGYHVIVFGNPKYWHFDEYGVEYVPYSMLEHRCTYQHFDYFISSRRIDELNTDISCNNIYIMSHEIGIFDKYWGSFAKYDQLQMGSKVKKISVLSEWHKNATLALYPQLKEEDIFITSNGVRTELYNNVDISKKRNMMVWSSCLNRGMTFFGQRVFPKVKKAVPDFELNICSYDTNIHGDIPEGEGINFIGTLDKQKLADLQREAKIWALPNYGLNDFGLPLNESFCITAVENGLAKNAIVCFNKGGVTTTLEGYNNIINIDFFNEYADMNDENLEKLSEMMADSMINILNDDSEFLRLSEQAYNIVKKYTWEHAALQWINEWENGK